MKTLHEIQNAIRDLPPYEREIIAYWAQHPAQEGQASAANVAAEHATAEHATAEHATAEHATAEHATAEHASAEHARVADAGPFATDRSAARAHPPVLRRMGDPERLSVDEYLALEEFKGPRFEYVAGRPYLLGAETPRHSLITGNLTASIKSNLKTQVPERAQSLFSYGVMLYIRVEGEDVFYCPDLMVLNGARDLSAQYLTDPILVVEVLSPSSERVDRREKAYSYRFIPALQEYVLIAQHAPRVTIHRRSEDWRPSFLTSLDSVAELRSLQLSIPLRQIYEGAL